MLSILFNFRLLASNRSVEAMAKAPSDYVKKPNFTSPGQNGQYREKNRRECGDDKDHSLDRGTNVPNHNKLGSAKALVSSKKAI